MQLNDETKTFTLVDNSISCSPINNDDNTPDTSVETSQDVKPVELVHEIQQNDQYVRYIYLIKYLKSKFITCFKFCHPAWVRGTICCSKTG